jgi:hypothetical protein
LVNILVEGFEYNGDDKPVMDDDDDQGGDEDGGNDDDYDDLDDKSKIMDAHKKEDNKSNFRTPNVKQHTNYGPKIVILGTTTFEAFNVWQKGSIVSVNWFDTVSTTLEMSNTSVGHHN